MARKSLIAKQKRVPKFPTRAYSRCRLCGRTRGFLRKTETCRICFRKLVHAGELPGWVKSSW